MTTTREMQKRARAKAKRLRKHEIHKKQRDIFLFNNPDTVAMAQAMGLKI
jgi:hypothetical protein